MKELRHFSRPMQVVIVVRQIVSSVLILGIITRMGNASEADSAMLDVMLALCGISSLAMWLYLRLKASPDEGAFRPNSDPEDRPKKRKGPIGMFVDAWKISARGTIALLLLTVIFGHMFVSMVVTTVQAVGKLVG